MEALTRLQRKDERHTEEVRQNSGSRDDKYRKNISKQNSLPHKPQSRNSLPTKSNTNSVVPAYQIYENLDPLAENLQNFSLPRIRQLWSAEPECTYNTNFWANQNRIRRLPSMANPRSSGNGILNDSLPTYNHYQKRYDGQFDLYDEEPEIIKNHPMTKSRARPDISPSASNSASNSTQSTGISCKNKRNGVDVVAQSENLTTGQLNRSSTDFPHSFNGTNSRNLNSNNGQGIAYPPGVHPQAYSNPFCPGCNGVIPLSHLETIPEMSSYKAENGLWNFNNFHHPLQRDNSIGGFTLNGQPRPAQKSKMAKFCSSHKIALVVSTFSLMVTIGLIITLLFMKKKGMMEPM